MIEHDEVGSQHERDAERLVAARRLADDPEAGLARQQRADRLADLGVVVDDEDADQPRRGRGLSNDVSRLRPVGVRSRGQSIRAVRRRSEFVTTVTLDTAIAAAASTGESTQPVKGYKSPAATGISSTL